MPRRALSISDDGTLRLAPVRPLIRTVLCGGPLDGADVTIRPDGCGLPQSVGYYLAGRTVAYAVDRDRGRYCYVRSLFDASEPTHTVCTTCGAAMFSPTGAVWRCCNGCE